MDNLRLAEKNARKGKSKQWGVRLFDRDPEDKLVNLYHILRNREYLTSPYTIFTINEGKERLIYRLPYYPDRIVHHAIMNVLEPIFVSCFTSDTYSCIKNRGVHKCAARLRRALRDVSGTIYCLKLDIKKFYPNIDHEVLMRLLRRKIKDPKLLGLLQEIIASPGGVKGVPIGNYLSQYLANYYLSGFDHWLKEQMKVRYYFRYCDDLVILGNNKQELRELMEKIREYLGVELKLELKSNYQIFPVAARGIDFLGYRFYHTHTMLRKSIKKNFLRMLRFRRNRKSIVSYGGWLLHCSARHLIKTHLQKSPPGVDPAR